MPRTKRQSTGDFLCTRICPDGEWVKVVGSGRNQLQGFKPNGRYLITAEHVSGWYLLAKFDTKEQAEQALPMIARSYKKAIENV
jgi:hypothetical protein